MPRGHAKRLHSQRHQMISVKFLMHVQQHTVTCVDCITSFPDLTLHASLGNCNQYHASSQVIAL